MNAPSLSPWLRAFTALAIVLGVADGALLFAWLRREPSLPALAAAVSDVPAAAGSDSAAAATEANASPAAPASANGAPADAVPAASPNAVLYGTVTQADGTAVQRGVLWIYRDGEHVGTSSPDGGVFAFAGLRPGEYRLASRIDDALPLSRDVQVDAPTTRLDLRLDPRWLLRVHAVTPDGQPLIEALGKVEPMLGYRTLAAAAFAAPLQGDLTLSDLAEVTAGLGPFRRDDPFGRGATLEKKTLGVLTLPPDQPVHVALLLRSAVIAQQQASPGQDEVTFTLDPAQLVARTATVKLRVVDATGAPVQGCRVALNDAQSGGGGGKPTGDDGRAEVSHLVPGRLRLSIMHKDLQGPPLSIDVPPGADLDLGDVTLQRGVEVAFDGKAMGERGNIRIGWLDVPSQPGFSVREGYLSTDNGATMRTVLFPGRYAVRATAGQRAVMTEIDTRALPAQPIRLDLQPGAPLRVRGGRPGCSVGVEIRAANGAWIHRRSLWGPQDFTLVLPIGSYAVDLVDAAGARTHRTVALAKAGAVVDLP